MNKVLIVDDEVDVCQTLFAILSEKGFIVKTVNSQEEIFDSITSLKPDIILLDVRLNGADGRNICKGLKNHFQTKHIPIILISGDSSLLESAKECKAEAFMPKPIESDNLIQMINHHSYSRRKLA